MKRWKGWGDPEKNYPIPDSGKDYLIQILGSSQNLPDISEPEIIESTPPSRLGNIDFISTEAMDRIRHSCGQSLPDWIRIHAGTIPRVTDGVSYPQTHEEIKKVIKFAQDNQIVLIPYGGGTSVVGHINPPKTDKPVLTLDLSRMNQLLGMDETSRIATFQAGIRGPEIESVLNKAGYTLGHFPQSFEFSTLGGWIASRSCGQQSYYYGRIENLFRGGHLITPVGDLNLQPVPASSAGPDLKQFILGSEGRLGIISQAIVQVVPLPEFEEFYGIFFKDWEAGLSAVREITHNRVQVSMLRLSDAQETLTTLILSGKDNIVRAASTGLSAFGFGEQKCLLILGVTGEKNIASTARKSALQICRKHGGLNTGSFIGKSWQKSRFLTPYLRNSLWEAGYALDTLETAVTWDRLTLLKKKIMSAISRAGEDRNLRILVFGHLSHVYQTGGSIYITYLFRRSPEPEENLEIWEEIKSAASKEIIVGGGTISHQHGVGNDHKEYFVQEIGSLGVNFLHHSNKFFDHDNILNPHVLIDPENKETVQTNDLGID